MASIGDLLMRVIADMTGFEVEVEKKAATAGDKAGDTFGQRMAKNAGKAFSAVVGSALAIATAQGLKLNSVLNDLQAETGAVGEDWEAMSAVVRRENGRTTESVEDIAEAVKGMRQDLGLTGDQIDLYADRIFDAGLATRTSAAFIVKAADDIGDAFRLDLDRSLGVIDQLIVSQQRFGGSVEERLLALADLAPALLALNQTEEDGIELLNAAAASGLDVTDVIRGLRAAATRLDRPFDEWLASVGAIADDQARLAATSDVVGARAGLAVSTLARALHEASVEGESFRVTQDEAADAATNMADKIDSGPIRMLKLLGERVGALLADVGTNPIITSFASIGTILAGFAPGIIGKFGTALLGGLRGIGSRILTLVAGEIVMSSTIATIAGSRVGAMTGAAFGTAMAGAIPLAMVAVAAAIGVALAVLIDKLFPGLAKSMADNFFKGVEAVKRFMGDLVRNVKGAIGAIERAVDGLAQRFQAGIDRIVNAFRPLFDALNHVRALLDSIGPRINEVLTGAGSVGGSAFVPIRSGGGTVQTSPLFRNTPTQGLTPNDWFIPQVSPPGFANGAWQTREGLAMLHDDEMVLPADFAAMIRDGKLGGDTINVTVPMIGEMRRDSPAAIVRGLRRLGEMGSFRK